MVDDRPGEPTGERLGFAELDLDRARRRGYPEAVLCAGKTPAQVAAIAATLRASGARSLLIG